MNRRDAIKLAAAMGCSLIPGTKASATEFFSRETLAVMLRTVKHKTTWDFNTSLGESIKEIYENLWQVTHQFFNHQLGRKINDQEWIVTSPEIASVFETALSGFEPSASNESELCFCGTINGRWKLYKDPMFPTVVLCGNGVRGHIDIGAIYVKNWLA